MRIRTVVLVALLFLAALGVGLLWGYFTTRIQKDREIEELSRAAKRGETQQQDAAAQSMRLLKDDLRETRQEAARLQAELEQHAKAEPARTEEEKRLLQAEQEAAAELRRKREERQRKEEEQHRTEEARRLNEAPGPHKLVVEAEWSGGFSCYDSVTLRRLLAWRKGDLNEHTFACASLQVKKILSGEAPEFSAGTFGEKYVSNVFLLNDAALAMKQCKKASGQWTLTALPDGSFAVTDLRDTPFQFDLTDLRKPAVDCAEDLTSGDPKRQVAGLNALQKTYYFSLIPLAIRLLDNVETDQGQTVGSASASALNSITSKLRLKGDRAPTSKIGWEKWWADLLAVEPFPVVPLEPGELRRIADYTTNQSFPEIYIDPHGHFAVMAVSRLNQPLNGARSGLRLLQLAGEEAGADDFVYKVPLSDRNCEPKFLAGASTGKQVALAWTERDFDPALNTVKFMIADVATRKGTPVDLNLKRVRHLALCAMPGEQWLLAYSYIPPEGDFLNPRQMEYGLLLLDHAGQVLERPSPFQTPGNPAQRGDGAVLSLARPSRGLAAVQMIDSGLCLLLLDETLAVKKSVILPEAPGGRFSGLGIHVGLAFSGETFCFLWVTRDILRFCTVSATGEKVSKAERLSTEDSYYFGGPAAVENGFAVIWHDQSQTRNQVRLAQVSLDGRVDSPRILFDGRSGVMSLALGAEGGQAHAVFFDRSGFPQKVWLKLVDIAKPPQPQPAK